MANSMGIEHSESLGKLLLNAGMEMIELESENAALKKLVAELIPMAKWYYGQYRDEKVKSIIERAKQFTDGR